MFLHNLRSSRISHLDFSEDDLSDFMATSSHQTEPPPTIPTLASVPVSTHSPPSPIEYTRSPNFDFSDLIEVGLSDVLVPSECVSLTTIPQVRLGERATYRVLAAILQQSPPSHDLANEKSIDIWGAPFMLKDVSPTQMEAFLDVADSQ